MTLSKETLKNLLDLMQKGTLAVAVVSIALLSNVALSVRSVEKQAIAELGELLRICAKKSNLSARNIINGVLAEKDPSLTHSTLTDQGGIVNFYYYNRVQLKNSSGVALGSFSVPFPQVVYEIIDPEWEDRPFIERLRL
jgi:hypothetical protein